MKKYSYLIIIVLISSLVLAGCLLSNVGQVPTTQQSGITYLTKGSSPGLVGLWHFDEGSGATAYDSSGNNNHGTITGATYTGSANAMFGDAMSFDGIDDYVGVGHYTELNPISAITVECWAKLDSVNPGPVLVRKMDTYSLQVTYWDGESKIEGWVKIGGVWKGVRGVTGGVIIQTDTWYHFAFTYDGTELKTYVNGQLDRSTSVTGSIDSTTKPLDIARCGPEDGSGEGWYTDGIIDEVRIWDTAIPSFNLNVEPKLDFNSVGTDHTVTATVTIDKVGGGTEPAPGVLVDFTVYGVNGDTDSVYTDSNGQATFTYTGDGGAGKDTITASLNYLFYQATPVYIYKYWLENFVTGGGKINKSTLDLPGKGAALTFAGTIGVLEGEGIVGQFQIVDHTGLIRKGAVSWHCNNGFSFLNFEGGSAESPEATHDTAVFEGEFVSNLGDTETLRLRIIDNGEPGARVDTFSIFFFDWIEWTIDGGNFQVHDIED